MESAADLAQKFKPPHFPESYFLSFEGIEAAGKSTQILWLKDYLEKKGFRVLALREPGGTPFGEKLRQAILHSSQELDPIAELCLFISSRAQLLTQVTLKELKVPKTIVIYDRFLHSSLAYQGRGRQLESRVILQYHQHFPLCLVPHKTFYLKIDPQVSLERQRVRQSQKDYFEKQNLNFYHKLVEGYEEACRLFPQQMISLDGNQTQDSLFKSIQRETDQLISQ